MLSRETAFGKGSRWRLFGLFLLVGLGYALFRSGTSHERAISQTLEALAEDAGVARGELPGQRDQRLQLALDRYFTDPLSVRHADLPQTGAGRRALLLWARLVGRYTMAKLNLEHPDISLAPSGRAVVKLDVVLEAEDSEGQQVFERAVELGLVEQAGRWQIEAIEVAPRAEQEPEARP